MKFIRPHKILTAIISVASFISSGAVARADFVSPSRDVDHSTALSTPIAHSPAQISITLKFPELPVTLDSTGDVATTMGRRSSAPDTAQVVLSALLAIGAFHAGRSLKGLHLSHLPDWYHTGAGQIGHVTPFDFEFCDLPVCLFQEPVARPVFAYRISRERCSPPFSQFFLFVESPRGPPLA